MKDVQLRILESFRERKSSLIEPVDVNSVINFLTGFRAAAGYTTWWKAQRNRGWKIEQAGPVSQMRRKKMTEGEIMDELIDIEIEACKINVDSDMVF